MSLRPRETEHGFDDSSIEPGVWRYALASRATVIVDAADYFALMQQAMLKAQRRIMLIGWDFDTRIHLAKGRRWWQRPWKRDCPVRLGSFVLWLARHRRDLDIRILKWSFGSLKFLGRGMMLLDLARWWPHKRIDFKFDTHHPLGCSHHQKIAVIDDRLAVCGGIDMTTDRWDTREHREKDPRRRGPRGGRYGPWHDATMMLEGEIAATLGELGRDRWRRAGGEHLEASHWEGESIWPDELEAQFTDVEVGIARTRPNYEGDPGIDEVARLFERQIACARKFIYAESQYFASRIVAEALARRLAEDDSPEVVIVHAATAEDWIERQAMDKARARLVQVLRDADRHGRLHFFVPYAGETPIYCHAKIMIVDDELLRIGSANLNNRSMGLDSECDVFIDCERSQNRGCSAAIRRIRHSLLAEHLGLNEAEVAPLIERHGSIAGAIEALGTGRPRSLRPLSVEPLNGVERDVADSEILDPETPEEMFEFVQARRGLFRRRGLLSRAKMRRRKMQGTR